MINIKKLLVEDRSQSSAPMGCLMAMFPKYICEKLNRFGERIIGESILYKEGDEFGRETEGHVTIRYGFTEDLNELQIRQLLKGQKPFIVELYGLDKFAGQPQELKGNPPKPYDVIYLKARSAILNKLNEATRVFPNKPSFYDYNPHATVAYVKPGSFPHVKKGLNIKARITEICYSPISGGKSYFKLE
jgi:hypothetical protein